METRALQLFEAVGIELEYMIVDRQTLNVRPMADTLMAAEAGEIAADIERGEVAWSNELVLHVIELKTNGPAKGLAGLSWKFAAEIVHINNLLQASGACLMPTAAHPWMDPLAETRLWPHEYSPIYEAYNRIFGCQGHGWSNLQSTHINLPFANDAEFGRLHAAIRLVLPIIPALTAASPVMGGVFSGYLDGRMQAYGQNSVKIPSIAGKIIPEPAFTKAEYESRIFVPMYADIAPHDPEGILRHEFLNSRGAIARFDRGAIEIRVLDIQECPNADLAAVSLIIACLKQLVGEQWASLADQMRWEVEPLARIYRQTIQQGEKALIRDRDYLGLFGLDKDQAWAGELWQHIACVCNLEEMDPDLTGALETILQKGTLARRILEALDKDFRRQRLGEVYAELCRCLATNTCFNG